MLVACLGIDMQLSLTLLVDYSLYLVVAIVSTAHAPIRFVYVNAQLLPIHMMCSNFQIMYVI